MDEMDAILDELNILPPGMKVCPVCAGNHDEGDPHNRNSFFYQLHFYREHRRLPTWDDAMEHCTDEVKQRFIRRLEHAGLRKRVDQQQNPPAGRS